MALAYCVAALGAISMAAQAAPVRRQWDYQGAPTQEDDSCTFGNFTVLDGVSLTHIYAHPCNSSAVVGELVAGQSYTIPSGSRFSYDFQSDPTNTCGNITTTSTENSTDMLASWAQVKEPAGWVYDGFWGSCSSDEVSRPCVRLSISVMSESDASGGAIEACMHCAYLCP